MKKRFWSVKSAAVMAMAAVVSMAAAASAADFFPLDVWEEMATWEQAGGSSHVAAAEAYSEPMPATVEQAPATFPFDVLEALNELDATAWYDTSADSASSFLAAGTNTYWLPEELARQ